MAVRATPSLLEATTTTSEILKSYSTVEEGIESLFRTARNLISAPSAAIQCKGLALFRLLADKDYPITIKDTEVTFLALSTDLNVRAECVQLFLTLIEKERELDVILDASIRLFHSTKPLRSESVKLLAALVGKNKAFTEAQVIADHHARSFDAADQVLGISLYEELVKARQFFENAASAAFGLYRTTQNEIVRTGSLSLIKALLLREAAHEAAFDCASILVHAEKTFQIERGRDLYQALLELRYFPPRIVHDANSLMASTSSLSLCVGLQMFIDLVHAGHAHQEAERAAAVALRSVEKILQRKALTLLGILAEKNLTSTMIIAPSACTFIRSEDRELQEGASHLMLSLIRHQQMYETAFENALLLYQSPSDQDQCHCLTIFTALVEMGQHYSEAEDIGYVFADTSAVRSVHEKVIILFKALVEKGQALESARKVAEALSLSSFLSVSNGAAQLFEQLTKKISVV